MTAIYNGRELAGTVEATAAGFVARDADGKRLGVFQTSVEAVSAVLRAWRNPDGVDEREAELAAAIEARWAAKLLGPYIKSWPTLRWKRVVKTPASARKMMSGSFISH